MASRVTQSRCLAACCCRQGATTSRLSALLLSAAFFAVAGVPPVAQAQLIDDVRIFDVSSEILGGFHGSDRRGIYAVNGAGFTLDTNDPLKGFHVNNAEIEGQPGSYWSSAGTFGESIGIENDLLPAHIVFDLNAVYDLDSFTVWNGNEFTLDGIDLTGRGAQSVDISLGVDPEALTPVGNYIFDRAPGADDVLYGQTIDLSGVAAADAVRYVRFDILSNHGDASEIVTIAEVRFSGTGMPPLPGDANRDGLVDVLDLDILQSNLFPAFAGSPPASTFSSWDDGDFNGDALVTLADYRIWKGTIDAQPGQLVNGTNVPEPASGAMLLLATGVALRLCTYRRAR